MRKVFKFFACLSIVAAGLAACDNVTPEEGLDDKPGTEAPEPEDPSLDEGDTLKLEMTDFKMLYYHNDNEFTDIIRFEIGEDEITGYYEDLVDLTSLVVDFKAAGKVYVGDVEQVSGETSNDFSKPVVYRLENSKGEKREYTVRFSCFTGLPVVYFNTAKMPRLNSKARSSHLHCFFFSFALYSFRSSRLISALCTAMYCSWAVLKLRSFMPIR